LPEREKKLPRLDKPREILIPLGVEHLGRMEEYLAMCHIAIDDHYTRILIEHNKITHWTYFRCISPQHLRDLKFDDGPAQILSDNFGIYVDMLKKNKIAIENNLQLV
jgi:hypothetical protein